MTSRRKLVLTGTVAILIFATVISFVAFSSLRNKEGASGAMCSLRLLQSVQLKGLSGRLDHMAVDTKANRLFLAALANNSLIVVDLVSGTVFRSIRNLSEPQDVLYVPDTSTVYVSNGGSGLLEALDSSSFSRTGTISFPSDPDNLRYDASSKLLFVGYGLGGIGVVNTTTGRIEEKIELVGHPESFQLEASGPRIFVNVPTGSYVAVIDRTTSSVVSRWPIPNATGNFAMALDENHHRLFIGTRDPPQLVIMDTNSGNVITQVRISQDPDDIFYDALNGCIYVAAGQGYVDIIKQLDSNRYIVVESQATSAGARTALFVPEQNRLYVAAPRTNDTDAKILVYGLS